MKSILALTILSLSFSAFSATSDTLLLKGTVPELMSISVAAESIAANLPLDTSQTGTLVAVVTEKSNSNTGYKVTIASANAGKLIRESGTEEFPYSLSYDGTALNLSTSVEQVHSAVAAVNVDKNLNISYTGVSAEEMVEGNYTDTVTFSIAAN